MRLLIYEHPCHVRHGVVDTAIVPPGQPALMEAGEVAEPETPQLSWMVVEARCKGCKHLGQGQALCKGEYRMTLDEEQVAGLPEKLRKTEAELEDARFEAESLRDDLADAEDRASDMQADSEMAKATVETVERLVKDVELYLSQVANSRTAYADAAKHLNYLRDLAFNARKRMADAEAACA